MHQLLSGRSTRVTINQLKREGIIRLHGKGEVSFSAAGVEMLQIGAFAMFGTGSHYLTGQGDARSMDERRNQTVSPA